MADFALALGRGRVIGIDRAPEMIAFAQQTYSLQNLMMLNQTRSRIHNTLLPVVRWYLAQGKQFDVAEVETLAPSIPTAESSPKPNPPSSSPLELLVTQAVTDHARTLGVLASRVETLETQLLQLQQERDNFVQLR